MNRISHPDWVKLCVDPNGRIKLRAKQKSLSEIDDQSVKSLKGSMKNRCIEVIAAKGRKTKY